MTFQHIMKCDRSRVRLIFMVGEYAAILHN